MKDILSAKEKIRCTMREKLNAHSLREREFKSRQIADKLRKDAAFQNAKTIMFYLATDEEVGTRGLIEETLAQGKTVLLPYVDRETPQLKPSRVRDLTLDLQKGSYDIMEPKKESLDLVEPKEIDLVIVPGLAFDHARYRLGRGKGYYDRFLAKLPQSVHTIGLAFDFQMVPLLPVTELDVPVGRVFHN